MSISHLEYAKSQKIRLIALDKCIDIAETKSQVFKIYKHTPDNTNVYNKVFNKIKTFRVYGPIGISPNISCSSCMGTGLGQWLARHNYTRQKCDSCGGAGRIYIYSKDDELYESLKRELNYPGKILTKEEENEKEDKDSNFLLFGCSYLLISLILFLFAFVFDNVFGETIQVFILSVCIINIFLILFIFFIFLIIPVDRDKNFDN